MVDLAGAAFFQFDVYVGGVAGMYMHNEPALLTLGCDDAVGKGLGGAGEVVVVKQLRQGCIVWVIFDGHAQGAQGIGNSVFSNVDGETRLGGIAGGHAVALSEFFKQVAGSHRPHCATGTTRLLGNRLVQ